MKARAHPTYQESRGIHDRQLAAHKVQSEPLSPLQEDVERGCAWHLPLIASSLASRAPVQLSRMSHQAATQNCRSPMFLQELTQSAP